jgi:hypothetical protein
MSVIPVLGRLRQENLEFKVRLCLKNKKRMENTSTFVC